MYTYDQLIARARHLGGIGVLLGIMLQGACGADSTGITPPQPSDGVPSALVGRWNEAAASGSQYCDPNGGGCTSAYGGSETYTFGADGTFVYSQLLEANLYGCIIKTFLYATGTLTVDGGRLTLTPKSARNQVSKTCGRSTDEQLTLDPSSYGWRVARAEDGSAGLYLTSSDGVEAGPFAQR
jgi:hypothetical protein